MAYTTCTNPTCKYPGERYEEYGMQKWCPRCSWPISARCPNHACNRELTKEIVKNRKCTCGDRLTDNYSIFHFAGICLVVNVELDFAKSAVEDFFRQGVYCPLIIPEKNEVLLFWERNKKAVHEIVFPILSELGFFVKGEVVSMTDYISKKKT